MTKDAYLTVCLSILSGCWLIACSEDDPDTDGDLGPTPTLADAVSDTDRIGVSDDSSAPEAPPSTDTTNQGPAPTPATPVSVQVTIDQGPVEGLALGDGLHAFLGLPYAAPVTGEQRWRPASPHPGWDSPFQATRMGPSCPQIDAWGTSLPDCGDCADGDLSCLNLCMDEDCLSLNIWTPASTSDDDLPVMLWIHGGSYMSGSSAYPVYDGARLANERQVVVVSINYRLGMFGFVAHPGLSEEAREDCERTGRSDCNLVASGNYGVSDWLEALRWVRRNIGAFGGDATKVTLFGESAGGSAVCTLLGSDAGDGLFHRAIIQSGSCFVARQSHTEATETCTLSALAGRWDDVSMECIGQALAYATGCSGSGDSVSCLRARPWQELIALSASGTIPSNSGLGEGVSYGPVIDGALLPSALGTLLAALPSASSTVDLMIGTTANEASIFFWPQGVTLDGFETAESFDARVREFVVGEACQERILDTYALPPDASSEQRLNTYLELISDAIFLCPMRAWSSVLDASQQPDLAQLYRYHFTHIPDFGLEPRGGASFALGAYHSAELPYVFGTLPRPENTSADCADAAWYEACCEDRSEDSWRCCGPGELRACYGPDDRALSDAMMGFWSSFARDGAPNGQAVEWNAWDPTGQRDIRLEWPLRTGSWLKSETCAAWDEYWLRVCR